MCNLSVCNVPLVDSRIVSVCKGGLDPLPMLRHAQCECDFSALTAQAHLTCISNLIPPRLDGHRSTILIPPYPSHFEKPSTKFPLSNKLVQAPGKLLTLLSSGFL